MDRYTKITHTKHRCPGPVKLWVILHAVGRGPRSAAQHILPPAHRRACYGCMLQVQQRLHTTTAQVTPRYKYKSPATSKQAWRHSTRLAAPPIHAACLPQYLQKPHSSRSPHNTRDRPHNLPAPCQNAPQQHHSAQHAGRCDTAPLP